MITEIALLNIREQESDLFEAAKNDATNYYITLENADTKIILKSSGNSWDIYTKSKKS